MRWKRTGSKFPERFWEKVEKTDICWNWMATLDTGGYGAFMLNGVTQRAHVLSLNLHGIQVPKGMETDHLCRNRRCVNPAHLEVVSPKVNRDRGCSPFVFNALKTHCKKGHPFNDSNTYRRKGNFRMCKECGRTRNRNKGRIGIVMKMIDHKCPECGKDWALWANFDGKKFCSAKCTAKSSMRAYKARKAKALAELKILNVCGEDVKCRKVKLQEPIL